MLAHPPRHLLSGRHQRRSPVLSRRASTPSSTTQPTPSARWRWWRLVRRGHHPVGEWTRL